MKKTAKFLLNDWKIVETDLIQKNYKTKSFLYSLYGNDIDINIIYESILKLLELFMLRTSHTEEQFVFITKLISEYGGRNIKSALQVSCSLSTNHPEQVLWTDGNSTQFKPKFIKKAIDEIKNNIERIKIKHDILNIIINTLQYHVACVNNDGYEIFQTVQYKSNIPVTLDSITNKHISLIIGNDINVFNKFIFDNPETTVIMYNKSLDGYSRMEQVYSI